jgi:hypothetical protein
MQSYKEEKDRQSAGIPLFTDKKVKDGWVLNLVKQNDELLSTSLYDPSGTVIENKVFLTQNDVDVLHLKEYITLFDDGPDKNIRAITKIKS